VDLEHRQAIDNGILDRFTACDDASSFFVSFLHLEIPSGYWPA
jgi:hypothetical protein